jgi:two-component system cell cycle sensor histidine kinase/response regulator CckA
MAVIEVDSDDLKTATLIQANSAFRQIFGSSPDRGSPISRLFHLSGAEDMTQPVETRLNNAAETPVSVYMAPNHELNGGAQLYIIDISAQRSLETQLSQSQKMQAIGQLAAGVAHDFNNLLQAMRLSADDLLGRHPIGDPSYADLQSINSTINRAASLVKKLLAFSRQQTLRPEVLDLGEALSDIMIVLRQVMVERVKLDIVFGRGVPDIMADKSQLETVLMNLCVNARDAMAEQGGGEITIETRALKIEAIDDMNLKQSLAGLASDNLAVISVSDTGSGIPPHILEKIFEPFFTTKEQGKGTGLGLATVYGIVQQSGGHLTVESTLGVGTSFHLYFPQVSEEDARAAAEAAVLMPKFNETRAPADLAGQGHILFVEDEDDVRLMAARTLRKRGYNVVEAGDGEEALEILEDDEISFDLMISDVVMPGMDGPTLLKRGKEALGDARIIFISGYAQEDFSELLAEHPDVSFLPKPFGLKELAEKVKEQIGESVV